MKRRRRCTAVTRGSVTDGTAERTGRDAEGPFDAAWDNVDLTAFTNFLETDGIRLAGRLSGHNLLEWPLRRFSNRSGKGELHLTPPDGVALMTREMPIERIRAIENRGRAGRPVQPAYPIRARADRW